MVEVLYKVVLKKEKHEVKWVLKEDLKKFININHNLFALDMMLYNKKIYDGDGIIVSNDENNKKKSQAVRNTIIEKYCI